MPYLIGVITDGAVRAEVSAVDDVQPTFAGPGQLVTIIALDTLAGAAVFVEITQDIVWISRLPV